MKLKSNFTCAALRLIPQLLQRQAKQKRRRAARAATQCRQPAACLIESLEDRRLLTAAFAEFIDPNPSADNGFGDSVVPLSTGNVVITAPWDDTGGEDAGAVYLFDGSTGNLISTLIGSTDDDRLGLSGVTALATGNYVICSPYWDNGSWDDAGAVTFGNGNTGVSGTVSSSNSLVGTYYNDYLGRINSNNDISAVTALPNGNYVVSSPNWDNAAEQDAGAVTFGNGHTGVTGSITASNSLIGTTSYDAVGGTGVTLLDNGNYVVSAPNWDQIRIEEGGFVQRTRDVGAVTWGSQSTGVTGIISSSNSLVGSQTDDYVGGMYLGNSGVTVLPNGNYVVSSPYWNNGTVTQAGAVTFGNGNSGTTGIVSVNNSLVGSSISDHVGSIEAFNGVSTETSITVLSNGNYIVSSPYWNNGSVLNAGAVTFASGTAGISGVISSTNSLVGSSTNDEIGGWTWGGMRSITELSNGNFVISSPDWDHGSATDAGAVTFGNGTTGVTGVLSAANSLVGSSSDDQVGLFDYYGLSFVTTLTNGNYVVSSPFWDNDDLSDAGAVTFGNGTTGTTGIITSANSLVGSSSDDSLGFTNSQGISAVTPLSNGNYVVSSPDWDNGSNQDAGAFTFGNGISGTSGIINASNSLVGSSADDELGSMDFEQTSAVTALPNGNYVLTSPSWDNGDLYNAGAVTFGDGTTGVTGVISAANSLIGTIDNDRLGYSGVTVLTNGNYVITSPFWNNPNGEYGIAYAAGAVTFANGSTGITGTISESNSLVGTDSDDTVGGTNYDGFTGVIPLTNGNYVVSSRNWSVGLEANAGAVTFGNGTTGVQGPVSSENSLIGTQIGDLVGDISFTGFNSVHALPNGNYVVMASYWDNGTIQDAGAITLGNGSTGTSGVISANNSLVGSSHYDYLGINDPEGTYELTILDNSNFLVTSPGWDMGANYNLAAVTFGNGTNGINGPLSANNSVSGQNSRTELPRIILDAVNNAFYISYSDQGKVYAGSQGTGLVQTSIDEISDLSLDKNAAQQTVNLTGITAGGAATNPRRVTATSNHPALIPDPTVIYNSPAETGSLTFTPVADQTGVAIITVTVEDGGLDSDLDTQEDNGFFQHTFSVFVDYSGELVSAEINMQVVNSPTEINANGTASNLPDHQSDVLEWSSFWVELWVNTDDNFSQGIFSTSLDLNYQSAYTTATAIEFGPAFSLNQSGTIDDASGSITGLSAETAQTDLGVSEHLLFARIKFESLANDGVDLDLEQQQIGPHDLELTFTSAEVSLVSGLPVTITDSPLQTTSIWANPYDLNDDDAITFKDLLLFASVYGEIPSQSQSDYAWFADLNQNDRVEFKDLLLFASNYGKRKLESPAIIYPLNYPDAWNNQLTLAAAVPAPQNPTPLSQTTAEEVLHTAKTDLTSQLSPEDQLQRNAIKVQVVDLQGSVLGRAAENTIYLDSTAAGQGWFIDPTPRDHSEFQQTDDLSLVALPDSDADGQVDLWTVIRHELLHLLGYEHQEQGLMESTLQPGVRKLTEWEQDADLYFASLQAETELSPF
ncbi:hypothetical protein FYZ48_23180 [Gimesia chilikensis]|uniref:hypothetical protein n=1 Tax=Gimesia chilikensis TaxID=2605989 RepID=UPI0011EFE30A|nr:hypothetical protein [Gimesia chilikensis]KAA0133715.1 hypothetical protein FYZ48_23180 [Gimesia chilikensis]